MTEKEQQRLQKMREKISQIKSQERIILNRDKQRQKKERTRHLLQFGTIVEKNFGEEIPRRI